MPRLTLRRAYRLVSLCFVGSIGVLAVGLIVGLMGYVSTMGILVIIALVAMSISMLASLVVQQIDAPDPDPKKVELARETIVTGVTIFEILLWIFHN